MQSGLGISRDGRQKKWESRAKDSEQKGKEREEGKQVLCAWNGVG